MRSKRPFAPLPRPVHAWGGAAKPGDRHDAVEGRRPRAFGSPGLRATIGETCAAVPQAGNARLKPVPFALAQGNVSSPLFSRASSAGQPIPADRILL
jgi:hypothetical protein